MNLIEKAKLANQAINNISRHDDEDTTTRAAVLDLVEAHIKNERQAMSDRVNQRLKQLIDPQ